MTKTNDAKKTGEPWYAAGYRKMQAASELPPSEQQGNRELSCLATCSLPVSRAKALLLRWQLDAEQMDERATFWSQRAPRAASTCRGISIGIRECVEEMRRELERANEHQPEESDGSEQRASP